MQLIIRLVINVLALLLVAYLVPNVHVTGYGGAILAAIVLGIANAVIRPILVLLSLPLEIITLGLFTLVINALIFWGVGHLGLGLEVRGFTAAFIGALVLSVISFIASMLLREPARR